MKSSCRSVTWFLFFTLPLMALARQFPNEFNASDKIATQQSRLKISLVILRDDSNSLSETIIRSPEQNSVETEPPVSFAYDVAYDAQRRLTLEGVPRIVGGAGSMPPKCADRCGMCTPCLPVNVPVGGTKTDDEYYPEVWRCQCDDNLYIP